MGEPTALSRTCKYRITGTVFLSNKRIATCIRREQQSKKTISGSAWSKISSLCAPQNEWQSYPTAAMQKQSKRSKLDRNLDTKRQWQSKAKLYKKQEPKHLEPWWTDSGENWDTYLTKVACQQSPVGAIRFQEWKKVIHELQKERREYTTLLTRSSSISGYREAVLLSWRQG